MAATIIRLADRNAAPVAAPSFPDWMRQRIGPDWAVVRRRTANLRGRYARLLLPREYQALEAEYERRFGRHPWKR